jgi:hypothetical protein
MKHDIAILVSGKIFVYCLRASTESYEYGTSVVLKDSVVYKPTKDGHSSIHKEERFKGLKEPTLSGHKLHLATEVEYVGLTLDKGLTWKTQLENVIKQGLQGFLVIACLAIMGAMKTTSTAAMEVLLGLPPLHVVIEAEAQAGIYGLVYNQQRRSRSTKYHHTKKSRDMEQEPTLFMGTNRMTPRYVLHKQVSSFQQA